MSFSACVFHQFAPQHRLPVGVFVYRLFFVAGGDHHIPALLPGGEPVGAEHLILVKQIRHFLSQLECPQIRVAAFQKSCQRVEYVVGMNQLWQQAVQPPHQSAFIKRGLFRNFAIRQHGPVGLPDKPCRKQKIHTGGDAQPAFTAIFRAFLRQRQLQPLGNTVALYQKGLAL